jgi:gluconolactonase
MFLTIMAAIIMFQTDTNSLVPSDAKLEKLAGGMKFTEGPVWTDADGGYLVFSDIPSNELKKWTAKDGLTTYRKVERQVNGNTRDAKGRLISCCHGARNVLIEESDGAVRPLVELHDGKKFNSPNDVVVKSDGSIWFTDPTYGLPKGEPREIDRQLVFRFDPATEKLTAVAQDFNMPNGLCFSPDEKKLYVADSGKPHHVRVFDVNSDGTLSNGGVFCVITPGVPDGMRCDEHGNLWSTAGDGVHVFSTDGKLITKIPVPETPANLCFGGADGKTLFITARTSLFSITTNVKGAR